MTKQQQFPALTALKGFFILIIVLHNTSLVDPLFDAIPGVAFITLYGGALGNSMFFLLSGFLLAWGYRERIMAGRISLQDYLLRRLKKIYPLYLITNIVALLTAISRYGISALQLEKLAFTLLLQNGGGLGQGGPYNSPTWFVSALFVCYAAYYAVCRFAGTPTRYRCLVALGIAWGYTLTVLKLELPFCYEGNGTGFMNFFLGCAMAELLPRMKKENHKWLRPAIMAALLESVYLLLRYGVEIICGNSSTAFAFVICPMILYLAFAEGLCTKVLQLKPFVYLGKISTSVYFWHLPLYFVLQDLLAAGGSLGEKLYMGYLLVLLVWSAASNRLIENR